MAKVCIISSVHNALDNRIFYREACTLKNAGYEVCLIAVHDKPETLQGITIIPLRRLRRVRRPMLWWNIIGLAISTHADIFHLHDPELLVLSPLIRLLTRKPVIYDVHEANADFVLTKEDIPYLVRIFFAWFLGWFEPFMAYFQSGLIFADDQTAKSFSRVNLQKATLFNFPETSFLENAFALSREIKEHKPIVLHLGSQKRFRGTDLMLDAFQQVLNSVPQARLLLVGAFSPVEFEEEFRLEVERRNLTDSILITGSVPFVEISKYLVRASVGWIPLQPVSKYMKNIPTKLFEYQAYAIPVVSSNLPSTQPFIKHLKTGFLVKADDPSSHAEAIIALLTNQSLASSIGKCGQDAVLKHFRWSDMEPRLLTLYQQVLSQEHKSG
jgi:glycosyltransferase involved in cell wall biosynthesis